MKIEDVKNINISLVFSDPINHLLISKDELMKLFSVKDSEKEGQTFIEAPGLKVLIFPNKQKEIIFEATRLLVNDRSGNLDKLELVGDVEKILKQGFLESDKLTAYGFNIDAIVIPRDNFDSSDLLSEKITKIENIKNAGISVEFGTDVIRKLEVKPITNKYLAHFNAEINTSSFPNKKEVVDQFKNEFAEFKKIMEKI